MSKLTVSVAMATYNGARFIKEQLDSFAQQTLFPAELVACDDGSTDSTYEILQKFAKKAPFPVRIYENEERLGCVENFLHALDLCTGDLVALSDQDDVWLPDKLAVCAREFAAEEVNLVIHLASLVGPGLKPLGGTWPFLSKFGSGRLNLWDLLHTEFTGSTMVFRRHVATPLLGGSQLRQALPGYDIPLGFLAGASGTVVRLRHVLSLHRCHETNYSKSHEVANASALAYIRSVRNGGSRLLGATQWLKTHTELASTIGDQTYARQAQETADRAGAFLDATVHVDEPLRSVLKQCSGLFRKRANALTERSLLYRDGPGKARTRFLQMILRGRYNPQGRGGLGLWSLAKDSRFLFQAPRSLRGTVNTPL